MKEIWKDIPNYEKCYQISNLGNVKSLKRTIKQFNGHKIISKTIQEKNLTPRKTPNGYLQICLCKNGAKKTCSIHRLVAKTFIGESDLQVDHVDGKKQNNKLDNLEYVTNSENMQRAFKNNLVTLKKNEINQYDLEGNFIKTWYNAGFIERELNLDHSNIIKCCKNKRNNCGGYIWKYNQGQ